MRWSPYQKYKFDLWSSRYFTTPLRASPYDPRLPARYRSALCHFPESSFLFGKYLDFYFSGPAAPQILKRLETQIEELEDKGYCDDRTITAWYFGRLCDGICFDPKRNDALLYNYLSSQL